MKLRARILRAVRGDCGPARKATLRGIARAHGFAEIFDETFRSMLDAGELVMYGKRKNVVYGLPGWRRK